MAFDNKSIRPILENEELSIKDKVNQLQTLHHEIVNGLMDEKDEAIQRAEKAEKAAESAKAEKEAAEKSLTDYKTQQTAKESRAAKESKFREQLKAAGVLEKYFDRIVRLSGEDIDKMELDSKGNVKNADKLAESLKTDWSDYVGSTSTKGAPVDNPPANYTGTTPEDFKKMNLDDRIKLKNSNPELYQQLRAK